MGWFRGRKKEKKEKVRVKVKSEVIEIDADIWEAIQRMSRHGHKFRVRFNFTPDNSPARQWYTFQIVVDLVEAKS